MNSYPVGEERIIANRKTGILTIFLWGSLLFGGEHSVQTEAMEIVTEFERFPLSITRVVSSTSTQSKSKISAYGRVVAWYGEDRGKADRHNYDQRNSRVQFEIFHLKLYLLDSNPYKGRDIDISVVESIPIIGLHAFNDKVKRLKRKGAIVRFKISERTMASDTGEVSVRLGLSDLQIVRHEDISRSE